MNYSFVDRDGKFSFESDTRVIVNLEGAAKKYLSKNESMLLACLLDGRQAKEKLMSSVWFDRGVVVTDASYYQLVTQLRKSFEEVGLPKGAIKTIPRYGLELAVQPAPATISIALPTRSPSGTAGAPSAAGVLQPNESAVISMAEPSGDGGIFARLWRYRYLPASGRVTLFLTAFLSAVLTRVCF